MFCIAHFDQLHTVKEEWDYIFHSGLSNSTFLSFDYISHWYNCFAEPDQVRVYRAVDCTGKTIGFLPLKLKKNNCIRVLSSLTNDHCFHGAPLMLEGRGDEFSDRILKSLFEDRSNWDVLVHSFSYSFLQSANLFPSSVLRNIGAFWIRRSQETFSVSLNKSYEKYFFDDLSAKNRTNMKRYTKRLEKAAGDLNWRHFEGLEGVEHWSDFVRIENSGWKGIAESSIKQVSFSFQQYYEGLVALLAQQDALHMYFLELEGKSIAAVFGYRDGETFHYAKTAYDENYKSLSPSNLLLLHIIEDLIENFPGLKRFHMFPWDYGYKHRFSNEKQLCFETMVFNKTLRGRMVWLWLILKKMFKNLIGK